MGLKKSSLDFARRWYLAGLDAGADDWEARHLAALAAHESGWGRAIPEGSNNPFGYHWIDGIGWECVETGEAGTGRRQRYRKFETPEAACRAVLYLFRRSRIEGYAEARQRLADHLRCAHRAFVCDVSLTYCPADRNHGESVWSIFEQLEGLAP